MDQLYSQLVVYCAKGLDYSSLCALCDHFGGMEAFLSAPPRALQACGVSPNLVARIKRPDRALIHGVERWLQHPQHHFIYPSHADYPELLLHIVPVPLGLFVVGDVSLLSQPQLAIVGSRRPSVAALGHARHFAQALVEQRWVVTSGLALGIDVAAHQGVLAAGGKTIAVLACGVDVCYPKRHQCVYDEIVETGALVSEFPLQTGVRPAYFPCRNRIMSGLALGVLVVEAYVRSGSMITARYALEQNRELFALPGALHNPAAQGCCQLIQQGAKLVTQVSDILEEFGDVAQTSTPDRHLATASALAPELQALLRCIDEVPLSLDEILFNSGLAFDELCSMLLRLEGAGWVENTPAGYVRKVCCL
jgi:DNA processing protein